MTVSDYAQLMGIKKSQWFQNIQGLGDNSVLTAFIALTSAAFSASLFAELCLRT